MEISLPPELLAKMDVLIEDLKMWPNRGEFIKEAVIAKIRLEKARLRQLEQQRKDFRQRQAYSGEVLEELF